MAYEGSTKAKARRAAYQKEHRAQQRAHSATYRAAHPEKIRAERAAYRTVYAEKVRAQRVAYYAANREKVRAQRAAYYAANPAKRRGHSAAYRAAHPEKVRAGNAAYRAANPDKVHAHKGRDRARKINAPINDFTAAQWRDMQAAYDHRCVYCGKRQKGKLTRDHIGPLSKGGAHTLSNIVPSCRKCNSKKHTGPPLCPVQPLML